MTVLISALWKRIDQPGHDTCRLEHAERGWHLHGTTVFGHKEGPASIHYSIQCDRQWHSVSGRVCGIIGNRPIDYHITRKDDIWAVNGEEVAGLNHLVDLDLNFTPATNFQHLRRVAIGEGKSLSVPVAWFNLDSGTLTELPQTYTRTGEFTFDYDAPSVGYSATLELAPNGFIRRYPQLWEVEQGF